jgi:DNA-binding NarL/FixJ family response regulator
MHEILIADDHPLFREALGRAVRRAVAEATVHEAGDVATLMRTLEAHPNGDLLLLDLNMPGAHGFSALVSIRSAYPAVPIVMVSANDDAATVNRALALGAAGFIPKSVDADTLSAAVARVLDGDTWVPPGIGTAPGMSEEDQDAARRLSSLTPQQFRVLGLVCSGLLNKQIAYELDVSEATVKAHMTAILRKLDVYTRTQAVMLVGRLATDPAGLKAAPEDDATA